MPNHFKQSTEKQKKLAAGVIIEGKSFTQAALDAGYSANTAKLGLKYSRTHSPGVDAAFNEASKQSRFTPEELKVISKNALVDDIVAGSSRGLERTVELLGSFKEHDWFVRSGDVQIGIFAALVDSGNSETLKTLENKLPELPEAKE